MHMDKAKDELREYDVRLITQCGMEMTVVIGNVGKNFDKTATFKATSWETIIRRVKRRFDK